MDVFFSCRKASNGRPLQGAASASAGRKVGTEVVGVRRGVGVVAASVLTAGAAVVSGGLVGASETSSASLKVSPREAGGRRMLMLVVQTVNFTLIINVLLH